MIALLLARSACAWLPPGVRRPQPRGLPEILIERFGPASDAAVEPGQFSGKPNPPSDAATNNKIMAGILVIGVLGLLFDDGQYECSGFTGVELAHFDLNDVIVGNALVFAGQSLQINLGDLEVGQVTIPRRYADVIPSLDSLHDDLSRRVHRRYSRATCDQAHDQKGAQQSSQCVLLVGRRQCDLRCDQPAT